MEMVRNVLENPVGQAYPIRNILPRFQGFTASLSFNSSPMKFFIATLLFICAYGFALSQQTIVDTITHDGLDRQYIVYVPDSYTPGTPAPLVLNFHGYGSNALEQMFYGDFRPIADTAGFLIVHPQGTLDFLGATHWNVGWGVSSVNDVGFIRALIDSLSVMYAIDPVRVYSTGMSNGGFFSYKLACELSERIAAIASVTGSMNANQAASCNPGHPMPVMAIHGTADETVQYAGTFLFASIASVLAYWVGFNACEATPIIEQIPDTDPNDGSTVEHQRYPNGTHGAEVEHYKIINGGHTWPGSAFVIGVTNQDMDASKEIWRFFSKYDINGLIDPLSATTHASLNPVRVYPNPARTSITIEHGSDQPVPFVFSTLQGQQILTGSSSGDQQTFPLQGIAPGMYLLTIHDQTLKIVIIE